MKSAFLRPFVLFAILVALCFGGTGFIYLQAHRNVAAGNDWIRHSQTVMLNAERTERLIERMVADERGYLLSGQLSFEMSYQNDKLHIASALTDLRTMAGGDRAALAQLDAIRNSFTAFTNLTDGKILQYRLAPTNVTLRDADYVEAAKKDVLAKVQVFLDAQGAALYAHIASLDYDRRFYFSAIVIGGLASALLLLLFNAVNLAAQGARTRAERELSDVHESFRLALDGSHDGIYDWNLITGHAYYSPHFWTMLGYRPDEFPPTFGSFRGLLHPEDLEAAEQLRERYLRRELPEYSNVFRMKHRDGQWIWINSRGTAIYNEHGEPLRLVGSHTDITAVKAYEERLQAERAKAERASRAKTDFLAHMSHEIRTPLTAISGIAEIFDRNQSNLDDRQKILVKTLRSSTTLLTELVNDILDFSKIESGELQLEDTPFPLAELFDQITAIMSIRAQEKNLSFTFDYQEVRSLRIVGDKNRLRQILINLIGNAIKFTDQGSVTVRAASFIDESGPALQISVADTGIGIEPEHFELVFERFKQADSSVSRRFGGTGLGLAISRRLARLMGGTITLESAPKQGSTFALTIPLRLPASTPATDDAASLPRPALPAPGQKRILLAEDYEGNIVMFSYLLESLNHAYDVARTGREALALWEAHDYDLILMDIQMPEMDGFAATAAIREREIAERRPRIPIIGVTAHALVGDRERCIEVGMDVYLPKPVPEDLLKAKIADFFETAERAA